MSSHENAGYHPASTLVALLTVLLVCHAVLGLVAAGSTWLEIQLLSEAKAGVEISEERAALNDARQGLIGLAHIGLFPSTAVLFGMWIHRANRNARALTTEPMQFSPGWSVGWYFVPIMNLFKPYQAMKEIWEVSGRWRRPDSQGGGSSSPLPWWWAAWVLSGVVGQAAFRASLRAESLDELLVSSWITLGGDILDVPLALLALLVVRGVHARQEEASLASYEEPGVGLSPLQAEW